MRLFQKCREEALFYPNFTAFRADTVRRLRAAGALSDANLP